MGAESKNTTAESWRERIVAQQNSGQPIRAWCREHGCHEHSFYWWRARLGLSPVSARHRGRPRGSKPVAFSKLIVEAPPIGSGEPIRLSLAGGRELTLPASMPVEQIARLVRAIEGAA
jgi:Transposase